MLLVGASVRGRDIAASVAARMHCGLVSDVVICKTQWQDIETTRMMYGGRWCKLLYAKGLM
jgi:electron transfer flavoprotein alpha subunit